MEIYRQISTLLIPAWKPPRESLEGAADQRATPTVISTLFGRLIVRFLLLVM